MKWQIPERPTLLIVFGAVLALGWSACYDDLHIEGDTPTNFAWVRVYVPEDDTHRIYQSTPPNDRLDWPLPEFEEGIPIGNDRFAVLDSLRGFEVFNAAPQAAGEPQSIAFVNVPGVTFVRQTTTLEVEVDNLGDTLRLDLSGLPYASVVERRSGPLPATPDPTTPPALTGAEQWLWRNPDADPYFECPDTERAGRFLGWRLLRADAKTLPLCTRN